MGQLEVLDGVIPAWCIKGRSCGFPYNAVADKQLNFKVAELYLPCIFSNYIRALTWSSGICIKWGMCPCDNKKASLQQIWHFDHILISNRGAGEGWTSLFFAESNGRMWWRYINVWENCHPHCFFHLQPPSTEIVKQF